MSAINIEKPDPLVAKQKSDDVKKSWFKRAKPKPMAEKQPVKTDQVKNNQLQAKAQKPMMSQKSMMSKPGPKTPLKSKKSPHPKNTSESKKMKTKIIMDKQAAVKAQISAKQGVSETQKVAPRQQAVPKQQLAPQQKANPKQKAAAKQKSAPKPDLDAKQEIASKPAITAKPSINRGRKRGKDRRIGPRRNLLTSRLTRNIFLSNLIGLLVLVVGTLTVNRFEQSLVDAKVENLRSLAATMTTYIGEQATGLGSAAELDLNGARQVLRGANVPPSWRVRLHDRSGKVVVDTENLDDTISVSALDPIITVDAALEEAPPSYAQIYAQSVIWFQRNLTAFIDNLPWNRERRRELKRDLRADIRMALLGETVKGPRYDAQDRLIVSVSVPVKRVQQVLGVVTVEANDVALTVNDARRALAPILGVAFMAALLSSLALTLFITLPMRRLA